MSDLTEKLKGSQSSNAIKIHFAYTVEQSIMIYQNCATGIRNK